MSKGLLEKCLLSAKWASATTGLKAAGAGPCFANQRHTVNVCFCSAVYLYKKYSQKIEFQAPTFDSILDICCYKINHSKHQYLKTVIYYYPSWFCGLIRLSQAVPTVILPRSCHYIVTRTAVISKSHLSQLGRTSQVAYSLSGVAGYWAEA